MRDKYFEELSNPKFPYGKGGFNTDRNRKITLRKYFQQRLLDVDNRFNTDLEYVLVSTELKASKYAVTPIASYFGRGLIANSLPAKLETKQW